jgi:hypothetical protein
MKRYLFLLAWIHKSESSCGDPTNIRKQADLLPEYKKGNEYILAMEIRIPQITRNGIVESEIAQKYGEAEAFQNDFTSYDTVSALEEISERFEHPREIKIIDVELNRR